MDESTKGNSSHRWCSRPRVLAMMGFELTPMGIELTPMGEAVSYHGGRQPAVCEIAQLLDTLHRSFLAHWQIMTDGGRLAET